MDAILTDILFTLARAALATFLAKELYVLTIPSLIAFSIAAYAVVARDPLRSSLPPYIGFKGVWDVLHGRRRVRGEKRSLVRLSIFARDVFWVSEEVMGELFVSGRLVQVFQGKGVFMEFGDKERKALDNVLTYTNLARFPDVVDDEGVRFIERVSKAKFIGISVIHDFVARVLQRMAYGSGPTDQLPVKVSTTRRNIRGLLLFYFFPFLSRSSKRSQAAKVEPEMDRKAIDNFLCLENLLWKQAVPNPVLLTEYVVNSSSSLISGALHQALVGLLSNYKIAREAQTELDALLISKNKLSTNDLESLPILRAIVAESLRLGVANAPPDVWYRASDDLWYKKWFLPKSSIVILDRDVVFPESSGLSDHQFRPERFLDKGHSVDEVERVAFGYGVPGQNFVKRVLFTSIAMILRNFTISRSKSDGKVKYVLNTVNSVEGG